MQITVAPAVCMVTGKVHQHTRAYVMHWLNLQSVREKNCSVNGPGFQETLPRLKDAQQDLDIQYAVLLNFGEAEILPWSARGGRQKEMGRAPKPTSAKLE